MPPTPARSIRVVVAIALLTLVTAACGGGSDESAATPAPDTAAAVPSVVESDSADDGDAGDGDCASAGPEINAGAAVTGFVTEVQVPSCEKALVLTSLGTTPDDVQSALGVCGIAANQSSSQGVASVAILSSDGTELVTGTNAGDCAAS